MHSAYDKYEERGISPEWGLYRDARHQDQDSHDLGGSHLELGDTGMLSNEYYPGHSLRISAELEKRLRNYYSFMVAYENLLRGTGLVETAAKSQIDGVPASTDAAPGQVYAFTKKREIRRFFSFLTLTERPLLHGWIREERRQRPGSRPM